eukprot:7413518-Pyramimonas_sp.AAC.1
MQRVRLGPLLPSAPAHGALHCRDHSFHALQRLDGAMALVRPLSSRTPTGALRRVARQPLPALAVGWKTSPLVELA